MILLESAVPQLKQAGSQGRSFANISCSAFSFRSRLRARRARDGELGDRPAASFLVNTPGPLLFSASRTKLFCGKKKRDQGMMKRMSASAFKWGLWDKNLFQNLERDRERHTDAPSKEYSLGFSLNGNLSWLYLDLKKDEQLRRYRINFVNEANLRFSSRSWLLCWPEFIVQQLALFSPILIFFQDGKTRTTLFFRFLRQWIRQAFILKIMRLCYSFFRLRKEVPSFKLSIYANRFTKPGNHCLSNAIFLASTFWLDKAVPLTKPFYLDLQRNAFVPRAFFSRWNLRK